MDRLSGRGICILTRGKTGGKADFKAIEIGCFFSKVLAATAHFDRVLIANRRKSLPKVTEGPPKQRFFKGDLLDRASRHSREWLLPSGSGKSPSLNQFGLFKPARFRLRRKGMNQLRLLSRLNLQNLCACTGNQMFLCPSTSLKLRKFALGGPLQ